MAVSPGIAGRQTSMHILVADDDIATRTLLASFLKKEGHTVSVAADGMSALDMFQKDRGFDLFILDVSMPRLDGLSLCRALKESLDRWVPIIMISANAEESAQVAGLDIGADYYLTKPVSFSLLRANVRASQRIASLQSELQNTNQSLVDYYNRNNADNDMARELLDQILYYGEETETSAHYVISPAGDFSGDMIISTRSPAERHYSMVADATGHGLPAAITLMPAVETFTRLARDGYSLETIVRELNDRLHASLPRGRFLAASVMMVEPHTHRLEVWNGGSPATYLIDNSRRIIEKAFPSRHPPLGVLSDKHFDGRAESYAHSPEQTLIACTDGVVETPLSSGELFGAKGLETLLTSVDRTDDILLELDRALNRLGTDGNRDDRAVLVMPLKSLERNMALTTVDDQAAVHGVNAEQDEAVGEASSGGWYLAVGVRGDVLAQAELAPMINGLLTQIGLSGDDADRAHVCVTELINNAIDHGILRLDSSVKQHPDGFEQYFTTRQKRIESLREGAVFVRANLDRRGQRHILRVAVSDTGEGFTTDAAGRASEPVPGELPEQVPHGRGIRLVQRLADRLLFHDGGATSEFHITVTAHSNAG